MLYIYYDRTAVQKGAPIAIRYKESVIYTDDLKIDGFVKERIKFGKVDCLLFPPHVMACMQLEIQD